MDQFKECFRRVKSRVCLVLAICWITQSAFCAAPKEPVAKKPGTGFSVKADAEGKYWFIAPSGQRFLSFGINQISVKPGNDDIRPGADYYHAVENQFGGDFDKWKADVIGLMQQGGFNTIGAWSEPNLVDNDKMYSTVCLYVAGFAWERGLDGFFPDFEEKIRKNIKKDVEGIKDLENVFGVFLDNEIRWYGESPWTIVANYTLLERALYSKINPHDKSEIPYAEIAVDFLKNKYKTTQAFSQAWGQTLHSWDELDFAFAQKCMNDTTQADREEFVALAAEKYYSKATEVVREMLPGKLILGTRYAQRAPKGVIEACGKYCDVISFNDYRTRPKADPHLLAEYYIWGGKKPIMITEYSWRAEENTSGNPNSTGAGTVLKTQADRGAHYSAYVEDLVSYPMIVGAHWFEFTDQSPQGRTKDGEDSNYGVVDIKHRPYSELLAAMGRTNKAAAKIHAESKIQPFTELLTPSEVIFEPGQRPERLPFIDLLKEEPILEPSIFNADDAGGWMDRKADPVILKYDTGQSWGCGVVFYGPQKYATGKGADHTTDMDGYSQLTIDAKIPAGLNFNLLVDESGVGPNYQETFNTDGGDDGESFIIKDIKGAGYRFKYEIELKNLKPRDDWGNQRGKHRVDMNAMRGFGLHLSGEQGKGEIELYSIKLSR
ncbi:MAG: beta-galactosidase [Planctomycetota bacterium]|jgi:agarase